jgi:hypothetical protein
VSSAALPEDLTLDRLPTGARPQHDESVPGEPAGLSHLIYTSVPVQPGPTTIGTALKIIDATATGGPTSRRHARRCHALTKAAQLSGTLEQLDRIADRARIAALMGRQEMVGRAAVAEVRARLLRGMARPTTFTRTRQRRPARRTAVRTGRPGRKRHRGRRSNDSDGGDGGGGLAGHQPEVRP